MRWSCIAFDLDNTLLDYESAFEKTMCESYKYHISKKWNLGKSVEVEKWFKVFKGYCDSLYPTGHSDSNTKHEYRRKRFIKTFSDFGCRVTNEMADEFQEYFYNHIHKYVEPFEGVTTLFSTLIQKEVPVGIITNGVEEIQRKKINMIGLDQYVDDQSIFISDEYGIAKPDSEIFQIAKQRLSVNHKPPLFIGDSWEHDIEGGNKAGWDVIFFNSCLEQPTSTIKPYKICYSFDEVKTSILSEI